MCGIAGIVQLAEQKIDPKVVEILRKSLAHRGPDGSGIYQSSCETAVLVHTRLSILDLSEQGHQPMTYQDSEFWITFNGEIYNFLELRKELEASGYIFKTNTDTEILLAAYIKWGEACQQKFNGMWAFAIWDNRNKTLFLSRDRFGVKPLYFSLLNGFFTFASEQKTLLLSHGRIPSINNKMAVIAQAGASLIESFEECLFEGCRKLLPGYCLRLNADGNITKKRWWKTYEHISGSWKAQSANVLEREFRERFLNACNLRMRSDTDIAFALSGGLDSSSVLCGVDYLIRNKSFSLQRRPEQWNTAFTASYPSTEQDELDWAKIPAEATSTPLDVVDVQKNITSDAIMQCILDVEDVVEPAIGPWLMYQRMNETGHKVSLEGHGPDEYLAGYSYYWQPYIADLLNSGCSLEELVRGVAGLAHSLPSGSVVSKTAFSSFVRGAKEKKQLEYGALSIKQIEEIQSQSLGLDEGERDYLKRCSLLERRLYIEFHYSSLPAILRNFDRCSMAHSVEVRSPFMDWELVVFGFSLANKHKIDKGITKSILRDSLTFLPESIRDRTSKIGFCSPMEGWLKDKLKELVLDTVNDAQFKGASWCDGQALSELFNECYQHGEMTKIRALWPVLNIQLLQQATIQNYREIMKV